MDPETYATQIQNAYDGEIWGEAFFGFLAEHCREPGAQHKFATMARLEAATKERMHPLMIRLGLDSTETPELQAKGAELAREWKDLPWPNLVARLQAEVAEYVGRYDDLARCGPREDAEILRYVADHERSIYVFTQKELSGHGDTSLDDMIRLLDPPA